MTLIRVLSSALQGGEVVVRSQIRMGSRVPGKRGNTHTCAVLSRVKSGYLKKGSYEGHEREMGSMRDKGVGTGNTPALFL